MKGPSPNDLARQFNEAAPSWMPSHGAQPDPAADEADDERDALIAERDAAIAQLAEASGLNPDQVRVQLSLAAPQTTVLRLRLDACERAREMAETGAQQLESSLKTASNVLAGTALVQLATERDDAVAERDALRQVLDEAVRALNAIRPLLPRVLHGDADVVDISEIVMAALVHIREIVPDAGGAQ